jgi:hypothetical protein
MTLSAFREHVQPILDASRDHGMTRAAGEPVHVELRPTALMPSEREALSAAEASAGGASNVARGAGQVSPGIQGKTPGVDAESRKRDRKPEAGR